MHAKPDLRVFLKWMIAGSGSVITAVIRLKNISSTSGLPNYAITAMKTWATPLTLLFCLISACFIGASFNHSRDMVLGGVFPYRSVPFFFNAFWTSLALIDLGVPLAFLCGKPKLALALAVVIMTIDVVVNTVFAAMYRNNIYVDNIDLIAQTAFFITLLIVAPIAWRALPRVHQDETIEAN